MDNQPLPPTAAAEVAVEAVDKTFGSVQALSSLTLRLHRSQITVLLGPNGAGKTTATRIITGALAPDRGRVRVFGIDPAGGRGEEVRRRCGVVSAKPSLYDRLSGWDNLAYAASLYGLGSGPGVRRRLGEAADQFGIRNDLDQQVGGYSTGMKTRLALARAVLHEPDLLLLDEPTSGLDPQSSAAVLELIRDMTGSGRTVLMCTHLLSEAEGLADQVVIVENGTDLINGDPETLARRYWPNPVVTMTAERGSDLDRLAQSELVVAYEREADRARIGLRDHSSIADIVMQLAADGVRLRSVVPFRPTLEGLYFAILDEVHQGHPSAAPPPSVTHPAEGGPVQHPAEGGPVQHPAEGGPVQHPAEGGPVQQPSGGGTLTTARAAGTSTLTAPTADTDEHHHD